MKIHSLAHVTLAQLPDVSELMKTIYALREEMLQAKEEMMKATNRNGREGDYILVQTESLTSSCLMTGLLTN